MTERQSKDSLGARLRDERKRLGLTQSEVAEATGLTRTSQFAYESGARIPDIAYVLCLERLGFDVEYIARGVRSSLYVAERLDWLALSGFIELVESWMNERTLASEERARLLKTLYVQFCRDGRLDLGFIAATFREHAAAVPAAK